MGCKRARAAVGATLTTGAAGLLATAVADAAAGWDVTGDVACVGDAVGLPDGATDAVCGPVVGLPAGGAELFAAGEAGAEVVTGDGLAAALAGALGGLGGATRGASMSCCCASCAQPLATTRRIAAAARSRRIRP